MKRQCVETGATIELAIQRACDTLGLAREEVSIEVLETPVKKLFRTVPAKVRATAIDDTDGEETPAPVPAAEEKPEEVPVNKPAEMPAEMPDEKVADAPRAPAQADPPAQGERKPRRERHAPPPSEGEEELTVPADSPKAQAAVAFVRDVAQAMGLPEVGVNAFKRGEGTLVRVSGDDVGALIGRRGETMEALSYLTGLVVNRVGGDYEKVNLDVGGYRSRREQDLQSLARRIARNVAKTGRSHVFEPMNPYERRLIHSVVGTIEGVKSESHGEGAERRITVSCTDPAKAQAPRKESRPPREGGRPPREGGRPAGKGRRTGPRPPAELVDREPVPIGEMRETTGVRPGRGPDDELLELLGTTGKTGKIDL